MTPHVFEIERTVWDALSYDDVIDTVEGMRELGIYNLPYDEEIVLRLRFDGLSGSVWTEVRGLKEGELFSEEIVSYPNVPPSRIDHYKNYVRTHPDPWIQIKGVEVVDLGIKVEGKKVVHRFKPLYKTLDPQRYYRDALIVLLASKGLIKHSKARGLAKLGIGKRSDEHVTTLKLAPNLEAHESSRDGSPVRPHLRRGHVRSQHHGPQNSLVKRIWIEPCFVNADADFVSTRKTYRVVH